MTAPLVMRSDRLVLRPYHTEDLDAFYAYRSDPEWSRYLSRTVSSREEAAEWVRLAIDTDWDTRPTWAITLNDQMIGSINLQINIPHVRAELSYSVARPYWQRGLATEAASTVIRWCFETGALEKICASTDPRNKASVRVLEKLGMRQEGYFRGHRFSRGERVDEVFFGLLRADFSRAI